MNFKRLANCEIINNGELKERFAYSFFYHDYDSVGYIIKTNDLFNNEEVVSNLRALLMNSIRARVTGQDLYSGSLTTSYYNEKRSYFLQHIVENTRMMHDSEGCGNRKITVNDRYKYLKDIFSFINRKVNSFVFFDDHVAMINYGNFLIELIENKYPKAITFNLEYFNINVKENIKVLQVILLEAVKQEN